jgi:hypothetical protein
MNLCALCVLGGLIWQNANHHGSFEKTMVRLTVRQTGRFPPGHNIGELASIYLINLQESNPHYNKVLALSL